MMSSSMTPHSNESVAALDFKREPRSGRRVLVWLVLLAVAGALVAFGLKHRNKPEGAAGAAPGMPERKPTVTVITLQPKPFALMLEGLGSVTPLITVTVKPQVEGPLLKVGYREGALVHKGDLLAEIDPRPFRIKLESARAVLQRDRASLHNSQLDLTRYEALRAQNLIAAQQLDAQRSQVDQALATVAMDEATAHDAELQLTYTRITSPADGVAGIRLVDPGNLVRATDTSGIVVLTQLDPIAVLFTLPQDDLPKLSAAMADGPCKVTAVSRGGDQVLAEGKLTVIDNQVNAATATVRLKAQFDNPGHTLWPNQFVRARIEVSRQASALTLPAAAVQQGPKGPYVYVLTSSNVAQMRPVSIALLQGDEAVIGGGLQAGDRVVIDGQDRIKPDAKVTPRDPNAPPPDRSHRGAGKPAAGGGGKKTHDPAAPGQP
jgi:membrane fusion protein, multidrug efflux system